MMIFRLNACCVAAFAAVQFILAAGARAEQAVDLELVLAVDVSLSMDRVEQSLQRGGYVAAFRDPQVQSAINSGALGRIAVTYVEWAGNAIQKTVVDWTVIDSPAGAAAFADRLAAAPVSRLRMTSISSALRFAASLFAKNQLKGDRRVIDISGDGPNNSGVNVTGVRDLVVAEGISINGLPIMLRPGRFGFYDIANLDQYYARCVIGGPGAFVVAVRKREDFGPSIRRKLILEISGRSRNRARLIRTIGEEAGEDVDCFVGEKLWQRYRDGGSYNR